MQPQNNFSKHKYTHKSFNFNVLKFLLITIASISILNYVINPYNIFPDSFFNLSLLKPEAKIQERVTKFIGLKLDTRKIDTVFIGTSRVDLALDKNYFKKITGKNAENMGMGGLSLDEYIDAVKVILEIHPEIKNIYLATDFATFKKTPVAFSENEAAKIQNDKNIKSDEMALALLSMQTTENSVWTIIKNILGIESRMFLSTGVKHMYANPEIKENFASSIKLYSGHYDNYEVDETKIEKLSELKKYCADKGVNFQLFTMPAHVIELDVIKEKNAWGEYQKWKKQLVNVTDVNDFQYINATTTDKISPDMTTFFDAAHSTYFVGNKIIEDFYSKNNKINRVLTKENVDYYNKVSTNELLDWQQNNQETVKWLRGQL